MDEETLGAKYHDVEIPAELVDQAKEYREKLIEAAVELDDNAMTAYLEGKEPDVATLKRLIRKATIDGAFFPVFCGSAFKNKGVQPLLDAVVDFLPSPLDVPAVKGVDLKGNEVERKPTDTEPLALLAFKIMDDPFVGTITFCRIYSGKLESGTGVMNSTKERKERVGRMLLMHANNREDIKEAYAGDILALAGLKEMRTGDTLCDPQKPVILEKMEFPDPVIEIAIEPKSKADQEKLGVVGLEARREFDLGELRARSRFALPVLAATGGMAAAIAIYLAFNLGDSSAKGWGIAMSTDTAFALGLLALFGRRVPDRLRAFILTVAVVDDILALLVIATVYTETITVSALLIAGGIFAVVLVARALRLRVGPLYFVSEQRSGWHCSSRESSR